MFLMNSVILAFEINWVGALISMGTMVLMKVVKQH